MEIAVASICCNRVPLSMQQAYRILEHCRVSWSMYLTYTHLKRSGYVVLRYTFVCLSSSFCICRSRRRTQLDSNNTIDIAKSHESSDQSNQFANSPSSSSHRSPLPDHLLDAVPNMLYKCTTIQSTNFYPPRTISMIDDAQRQYLHEQLNVQTTSRSTVSLRSNRTMPIISEHIRNAHSWHHFKEEKRRCMSLSSRNNVHMLGIDSNNQMIR